MHTIVKVIFILFLSATLLSSCTISQSTPNSLMEITSIPTVSVEQVGVSTAMFISPATATLPTAIMYLSSTPLAFTDPSVSLSERITYYYFVTSTEKPPEGTVFMPYALAPTYTDEIYTDDIAANLKNALNYALQDHRNIWVSNKIEISDIFYYKGYTEVILEGEYFGMGGAVLQAASRQILLTIFANPIIQSARISLNNKTIWNLGVSIDTNAKPNDFLYTRPEVESLIKENAYPAP